MDCTTSAAEEPRKIRKAEPRNTLEELGDKIILTHVQLFKLCWYKTIAITKDEENDVTQCDSSKEESEKASIIILRATPSKCDLLLQDCHPAVRVQP